MRLSRIQPGLFVKPSGAKLRGVTEQADLAEIWNAVGPCFGYLKPDGWRIQLHMQDGNLNLFSRVGNDLVNDFPHLAQRLCNDLGNIHIIIDTEIVGLDQLGRHVPPRRINRAAEHMMIILDGLFIDDRNITGLPTAERVKATDTLFHKFVNKNLMLAHYQHIAALNDLHRLYDAFLDQEERGFDGVILKAFNSSYFDYAIKVKKETTVDAVVIGAYISHGRVSSLLLAVFDKTTNHWIPIGKIAKGGDEWDAVCNACLEAASAKRFMNVLSPPASPSIWIKPNIVVQVTARTIRPGAQGGYVLSLEAPRNVFIRRDKDVNAATTFAELVEMAGIETRLPMSPTLFSNDNEEKSH